MTDKGGKVCRQSGQYRADRHGRQWRLRIAGHAWQAWEVRQGALEGMAGRQYRARQAGRTGMAYKGGK